MIRRLTQQREQILNILKGRCDHPTADQIYQSIRLVLTKISLGTVYRNLDVLQRMGWVSVISMPGEPRRFDCNLVPHDHFRCSACGKIFDLPPGTLPSVESMDLPGFTIRTRSVDVEGICRDCNRFVSDALNICDT